MQIAVGAALWGASAEDMESQKLQGTGIAYAQTPNPNIVDCCCELVHTLQLFSLVVPDCTDMLMIRDAIGLSRASHNPRRRSSFFCFSLRSSC